MAWKAYELCDFICKLADLLGCHWNHEAPEDDSCDNEREKQLKAHGCKENSVEHLMFMKS